MQRRLYWVIRNSLVLGWLLLALAGQARALEQNILVLGDSISAAYGMSLEQGWVAQMASQLQQQSPPYAVVNASISGETTGGGLGRLPSLLQQHQPVLVIIELGGNDGLRGLPLGTLRENLTKLVNLTQQTGAKVILLPMEIPPNYGARYTTGFRETYREVADETDSILAPFILNNVAIDPTLMQEDGLHPSAKAQPILLNTVLPTVTSALAAP